MVLHTYIQHFSPSLKMGVIIYFLIENYFLINTVYIQVIISVGLKDVQWVTEPVRKDLVSLPFLLLP
jgi:hypothetical protein